jgi:uncharacterized membrane protein (UPF0127 family)
LLLLAGCASAAKLESYETTLIEVGGQSLDVAVAETSAQRSQGLRGVEKLPPGIDGMLFVFGEPRTTTFGMRDTLIPLDLWWFDEDGHLLGSVEMEPCPGGSCASYGSPGVIGWALETPQGELELVPGDDLIIIG